LLLGDRGKPALAGVGLGGVPGTAAGGVYEEIGSTLIPGLTVLLQNRPDNIYQQT
jgi:hypothetical protein